MCSVFRSDCVDMLGRGPHGLGSWASLGAHALQNSDTGSRKPKTEPSGRARGPTSRNRCVTCGSREQRVLDDHRGSCVSLCQPLPYSRRPVHGCLG